MKETVEEGDRYMSTGIIRHVCKECIRTDRYDEYEENEIAI